MDSAVSTPGDAPPCATPQQQGVEPNKHSRGGRYHAEIDIASRQTHADKELGLPRGCVNQLICRGEAN